MTIAVVWQEDGYQWCAADTRLVAGADDKPTTEIGSKIYVIPLAASALNPDSFVRVPHYVTQYGFVYAGAALPASMTAVTASTLLQKLARPGGRGNPPTFEEIAIFMHRLSRRFMSERRTFGAEGLFSAAFFGWCPHTEKYRLAHIDGRDDFGGFRVDLSYPDPPEKDGEPWLILGNAKPKFETSLNSYRNCERHIGKRVPRRVIERMVAEQSEPTVGGATSIGMAHQRGFELFYGLEPIVRGEPAARGIFNGLDLNSDIGQVGQYLVAINGMA